MNLSFLNIGRQGSKRAACTDANPRAMLRRLIESSPDADRDEIEAACLEQVENGSRGLWLAIFDYWFANTYASLTRRPDDRSAFDAMMASGRMQLLEMIVPGAGKALGDMTGTALVKLGGRYATLGKKVGRRIVRNALTEREVANELRG